MKVPIESVFNECLTFCTMSVVGICTMALVAWHDDKLYLIVKPSAMLTHCLVFLLIYNIDWDLLLMNAFFTPFGIKNLLYDRHFDYYLVLSLAL